MYKYTRFSGQYLQCPRDVHNIMQLPFLSELISGSWPASSGHAVFDARVPLSAAYRLSIPKHSTFLLTLLAFHIHHIQKFKSLVFLFETGIPPLKLALAALNKVGSMFATQ